MQPAGYLLIFFCLSMLASCATLPSPLSESDTVSATSLCDKKIYKSLAYYNAASKCNHLTVGTPIGEDGTLLWQTGNGKDIQRVHLSFIFHDLQLHLTDPDSTRLGFLSENVSVHAGFQKAWLDTTDEVLKMLETYTGAQSRYRGKELIVTGNSLGAAIALLQAVRISHKLGREVTTILYGLPRVGNQAFADAVDKLLPNQRHIVHYRDPIPHVPSPKFGYVHPSGEVWIRERAKPQQGELVNAVDCKGQEDENCSRSVPFYRYLKSYVDHKGPYFGVVLRCREIVPVHRHQVRLSQGGCSAAASKIHPPQHVHVTAITA